MKYTKTQREKIKSAFTAKDRAKLKQHFKNGVERQYVNGLRRTSPERAREIASVVGRQSIIRVLLPELFELNAFHDQRISKKA